jgi:type IV secretory pathway VirJ component
MIPLVFALLAIVAEAAELPAPQAGLSASATLHVGGRFGDVTIYRPAGAATRMVLFVSGDGGWNLGVVGMARQLAAQGAIVVGINVRHYLAALASNRSCVSLAADFELLSHDVQKQLQLPKYLPPILAGYSSGATVVYAALAQAPPGTFSGAMSLGFCADQDFHSTQLCAGAGLHYTVNQRGDFVFAPAAGMQDSWQVLQGQQDQVCSPAQVDAFVADMPRAQLWRLPKVGHGFGVERNWAPQFRDAYLRLEAVMPAAEQHVSTAPDARITGLPLVEVTATAEPNAAAAGRLAVVLSGDGGWASLDRRIASSFAQQGIPVVGIDSLRYFWSGRTPEQAASDVAALISHYMLEWHRARVDLVGYSFGADVLPFIVNRLPAAIAARVSSVTLVEPSQSATFEIHVSNWLPGVTTPGAPLAPELARLKPPPLCIYGGGGERSICSDLPATQAAQIGTGHHLGGDGDPIVDRILRLPAALQE